MKIFGKSVFELIYRWRSYDLDKIVEEIREVKAMAPDDFRQWQLERRWEMVRHHYEHNDFYREKIGDTLPEAWSALPVVTKADLQTDLSKLITKPYRLKDLYSNSTSGSSGNPLTFVKDPYTQARVWAAKKYFFNLHGFDIGDKEARFFGIPKSFKSNLIQRTKDAILNRYRFVIFEMSDAVFSQWVKKFSRTAFDYAYGYTSSIVLFSRYLNENQIVLKEICPTLKLCMATSETCTPEDKAIIEKAFGVPVVQEYGAADAGLLGYECEHGTMHIPEENVFVEADEEGNLLITDLFNRAYPFVRYKVGDMAEIVESNCPCGSHFRVIAKLMGRTNDVIQLPSGNFSPGFTFYYVSRSLLESSGVLKEFIIRQTAIDTFEFDVVSGQPLTQENVEDLKKTAEEYLEPGLNVIIHQVDRINRPASGKIKHFYSELSKS